MKFRNPQNDHVEQGWTALSWLWCFLFGPLYLAARNLWGAAAVTFLLNSAASYVAFTGSFPVGISLLCCINFVAAVLLRAMVKKYYLHRGWRVVEEIAPESGEAGHEERDVVPSLKKADQLIIFAMGALFVVLAVVMLRR